jgi:hypothetical protein
MKNFIFTFVLLSSLVISSCSKGCDENDVNKSVEAYTAAVLTYAFDQTKANCDALKKAANNLSDDFGDCDQLPKEVRDGAKASLADLDCK